MHDVRTMIVKQEAEAKAEAGADAGCCSDPSCTN